MGVDFYTCKACKNTHPDCSDYATCTLCDGYCGCLECKEKGMFTYTSKKYHDIVLCEDCMPTKYIEKVEIKYELNPSYKAQIQYIEEYFGDDGSDVDDGSDGSDGSDE